MSYGSNGLRINHFSGRENHEVAMMSVSIESTTAFAQRTRLLTKWK